MTMEFDRNAFAAATGEEREALCLRLAATISQLLDGSACFHDAVIAAVSDLRKGGHDLWSYDEEDDFEVWGPNYAHPSGAGILITFRAVGLTEVKWSTQ
jgi:hypothetical protein